MKQTSTDLRFQFVPSWPLRVITPTSLLLRTLNLSLEDSSRDTTSNSEVRTKLNTRSWTKELDLLQQLNLRTSFGSTDTSKVWVFTEEWVLVFSLFFSCWPLPLLASFSSRKISWITWPRMLMLTVSNTKRVSKTTLSQEYQQTKLMKFS